MKIENRIADQVRNGMSRECAEEFIAAMIEAGQYADDEGASDMVQRVSARTKKNGGSQSERRLREKGFMS